MFGSDDLYRRLNEEMGLEATDEIRSSLLRLRTEVFDLRWFLPPYNRSADKLRSAVEKFPELAERVALIRQQIDQLHDAVATFERRVSGEQERAQTSLSQSGSRPSSSVHQP